MRKSIAILDSNLHRRQHVSAMLQAVYGMHGYGNLVAALPAMKVEHPDLIIIGHQVGEASGVSAARDIRRDRQLSGIPIIYISERLDPRLRDQLLMLGVKAVLSMPLDPRDLMTVATDLMASEVERSWQELPPHQRKVLEDTLSVFNNMARLLALGEPPEMGPITDACSSLVDALAREQLVPLLEKIRNHDNYTFVHSMRFAAFIGLFARAIGLPKPMQVQVACGGLMHDMGMMTVPPYVIYKQSALTSEEWKQVRGHVATGQRLLQAMGQVSKGVEIIVTQHHERLDGSGYPNGLKGAQLNELARMAGIIDVFCALTDRRPHKNPISAEAAFETMATTMGGQIDLDLLPRFREILLESGGKGGEVAAIF